MAWFGICLDPKSMEPVHKSVHDQPAEPESLTSPSIRPSGISDQMMYRPDK